MSLGIFSFDLEAFINSFSEYFEETEPALDDSTLESIADTLENLTVSDFKADENLMATILDTTVTSIIAPEKNIAPVKPAAVPASKTNGSISPNEQARKELERLLRTLQTSVIHNYRDSDIIDESVSLSNVTNFPKNKISSEAEDQTDKIRDDRRRENLKLERLREELKRARLRSNNEV